MRFWFPTAKSNFCKVSLELAVQEEIYSYYDELMEFLLKIKLNYFSTDSLKSYKFSKF
jgi:hypothetical protein